MYRVWEQGEQVDKAADIPTYLICDFVVWVVGGNDGFFVMDANTCEAYGYEKFPLNDE